jgi:hypothetical protein
MVKIINKKKSKNTFVIDGLINSNEKISKIIKKAKKKNIKSVSLLINYDQEKATNKKKKVIRRKNNKKQQNNKNLQIKNIAYNQEKEINKELKLLPANSSISKEKENINKNSFDKNIKKEINPLKQNEEIINSNKTIGEIIEQAEKNNVKSISITINYQKVSKKRKRKHHNNSNNNNPKNNQDNKDKKIDQSINNKAENQEKESISNNQDVPKIEEENIEIKDLNTEELRIFKIRKSKYVKISNPNKYFSSDKNSKK